MTVEDIAREVGVGKGTIYLHFSSKEEIVLSHVDRIVERLKERLWAIARSDATAAIRIRHMLLTRVLFRFDSIQHYTQSLNDLLAVLRPGLLARRARLLRRGGPDICGGSQRRARVARVAIRRCPHHRLRIVACDQLATTLQP